MHLLTGRFSFRRYQHSSVVGVLAILWLFCAVIPTCLLGQEQSAQKEVALQILLKALTDTDAQTKALARRALRSDDIDHELLIPELEKWMTNDDVAKRTAAVWTFSVQQDFWPDEVSTAMLKRLMANDDLEVVKSAISLIEQEHAAALSEQIQQLLSDHPEDAGMRYPAILALTSHEPTLEMALPYLDKEFGKWEVAKQSELMERLAALGKRAAPAIDFVATQSDSTHANVRNLCTRIASNMLDIQPARRTSRTARTGRTTRPVAAGDGGRMEAYVDAMLGRYDSDSNGILDQAELDSVTPSFKRMLESRNATKTSWTREEIVDSMMNKR